jgi:hypothetical protein
VKRVDFEFPGRDSYYGLYAKEKRSFARFVGYLFLCFLVPGLVFLCVYLVLLRRGKVSELPSAGWPLSTAMTLATILMAELVHSREDKKGS